MEWVRSMRYESISARDSPLSNLVGEEGEVTEEGGFVCKADEDNVVRAR
jgi:hypothetical protein